VRKINFKDLCKLKAGGYYHLSEKYTHIPNFVEGDYLLLYADNTYKDISCVFRASNSTETITISAEKAQYLDFYELDEN